MALIGMPGSGYELYDNYILDDDIGLSMWTPIGTDTAPFSGTFDGDDNTISIAYFSDAALAGAYLGIFGYVAKTSDNPNGGYIHDLEVQAKTSQYAAKAPSSQYVGSLVGWADQDVALANITASGTLDYASPNKLYLGGIAGYLNGASLVNTGTPLPLTTIEINSMSTGANYSGGAVGYGDGATITGISTAGPVTIVDGTVNTSAGGVTGYTSGTAITNCHATGSVTANLQRSAMIYVGGLAGYTRSGTVSNSHAQGSVLAVSNYPYAGGLVGYNYAGNVISQSYAAGSVTATGNTASDNSYPYAGGLVGYNSSGSVRDNAAITTIENCYATGNVRANGAGYTAWAGGIAGSNALGSVISKTYATGTVYARIMTDPPPIPPAPQPSPGALVGGIVGFNYVQTPVIEYSAALNTSITGVSYGPSPSATAIIIHRVEGSANGATTLTNNIANAAMALDPPYTPVSAANGPDGADAAAQPGQTVYEGLGWTFGAGGVWKKGATDPYPLLSWQ
jgi:hypothetical protein